MSKVKIGGACLNQTPIDWGNNLKNIRNAITEAKNNDVKILCLPELCITAYGCQDLFLTEWVVDSALSHLCDLASECTGISVAIGLPLRHKGNVYNTTCVITNGEINGFYAKQFLANDGIHYEKRWFTPWQKNTQDLVEIKGKKYAIGDLTFDIFGVHIGFEICEDAWHEDRPGCRLYEKGIQLIMNPSASHFAFGKVETRENLVVASSKTFECHYLYVNQLGNESGRVIYDGDILLANKGSLLARNKRLSFQPYNLLTFEIDTDKNETPNLNNQHHDTVNKEFGQAVGLALFDYLRKSKSKGYTLSLSGGADSSSIAVLVAEMISIGLEELGTEDFLIRSGLRTNIPEGHTMTETAKHLTAQILFTAYQGTKNSSEKTLNSAKNLANSIGAKFSAWEIDDIIDKSHKIVESALARKLSWETDDIAMQNIQARSRSPLIWMFANINNSILLTTSNRSEGDVGYTTMDGDTSGSLAPIAGVDKPFIIQWLKYAETELGYTGLKYVNSLTPTAELRPQEYTQTDEDDLMPYELLLQIERLAIQQWKSPLQVYQSIKKNTEIDSSVLKQHIRKFFKLWTINQWKRERLAPSFHLDDFNVDPKTWCRFPILSGGFEKELKELDLAK